MSQLLPRPRPFIQSLLLGLMALNPGLIAAADELPLTYIEKAPYYVTREGQAEGFLLRHVIRVMNKAGISVRTESLPAKRALLQLRQDDRAECSVGWFHTDERASFGRFSQPIFRDPPMALTAHINIAPRLRSLQVREILNRQDLSIGLIQGYSYGKFLDSLIEQSPSQKEWLTITPQQNLLRVAYHRVDLTLIDQLEFAEAQHNLPDRERRMVARSVIALIPDDMPTGNDRYLLCTRSTPDAVIQRFNDALATTPIEIPYQVRYPTPGDPPR